MGKQKTKTLQHILTEYSNSPHKKQHTLTILKNRTAIVEQRLQ